MSLTKFNGETNNIQSLPDKPTQTASQLKTLFDKTGADLKTYINETLTTELDTTLGTKANSSNVYTKTDVYNKEESYSKTETDTLLGTKADSSNVYTKTEVNTLLGNKANTSSLSSYKLKGDFSVMTGTVSLSSSKLQHTDNLPSGFTASNSVLITFAPNLEVNSPGYHAYLNNSKIVIGFDSGSTVRTVTFPYKAVIMKIS